MFDYVFEICKDSLGRLGPQIGEVFAASNGTNLSLEHQVERTRCRKFVATAAWTHVALEVIRSKSCFTVLAINQGVAKGIFMTRVPQSQRIG